MSISPSVMGLFARWIKYRQIAAAAAAAATAAAAAAAAINKRHSIPKGSIFLILFVSHLLSHTKEI